MSKAALEVPATREKPAAVYLPVIPLYERDGDEVTIFSRRGGVCAKRAEAEAVHRLLPAGKHAVAEIVEHDDRRRLASTLSLGDLQEMLGRTPRIKDVQAQRADWRDFIINDR